MRRKGHHIGHRQRADRNDEPAGLDAGRDQPGERGNSIFNGEFRSLAGRPEEGDAVAALIEEHSRARGQTGHIGAEIRRNGRRERGDQTVGGWQRHIQLDISFGILAAASGLIADCQQRA